MMLQPSTPVKKEKTLQPRYNPPQAKTLQPSTSVKNAKTLQPPKTANVTDTKNVSKPSHKEMIDSMRLGFEVLIKIERGDFDVGCPIFLR